MACMREGEIQVTVEVWLSSKTLALVDDTAARLRVHRNRVVNNAINLYLRLVEAELPEEVEQGTTTPVRLDPEKATPVPLYAEETARKTNQTTERLGVDSPEVVLGAIDLYERLVEAERLAEVEGMLENRKTP